MSFNALMYRLRCKHESAELEKLEKQRRDFRLFNDPVVIEDAMIRKVKAILKNLDNEQKQVESGSFLTSFLHTRVSRGCDLHSLGDTMGAPLYVSESLPGQASSFSSSAGRPYISPEDVLCAGEAT